MRLLILVLLAAIIIACSKQMNIDDARTIAEHSACAENLGQNAYYNNITKTWWIDMTLTKKGCSPACVVYENRTAEINWRCTGLLEDA